MEDFQYRIIPYSADYESSLLDLEKNAQQGTFIQLEMLRDTYLSRSTVFERYQVLLAVNEQKQLMGALAAAITPIVQNGDEIQVGVCYDVRVKPEFRGHGLTKKMGQFAVRHFYEPNHADYLFMTLKSGNEAVLKSAKILGLALYQYSFVYLTIPTGKRVDLKKSSSNWQRFHVRIASDLQGLEHYYEIFGDGLGIWNTHLMYRLRIKKIHPLLKWGLRTLNFFRKEAARFPLEGEDLSFASLFGCTPENAHRIDEVLQYLQNKGVNYLSVCCSKGDFLYTLLKPLAINEYSYTLLSTFPTSPEDDIVVDVRCL
jgi:GNAT superfamily N-acetyltransferase